MPDHLSETTAGKEREMAQGRLLVTGQMRSGTTMLASFLNSQEDIYLMPDGLRVPTAALNAFGTTIGPSDALDPTMRARLWAAMLHVSLDNTATPQVEREIIEKFKSENTTPPFNTQAELYLRLLGDIATRFPEFRYHGTKATRGERLAASVVELGAKAIVILRDPRAVFTSQQARLQRDPTFVAADVERFVNEWRASCDAWRNSGDAVLALRYEDFVTGEGEFSRISEYLGVDIKPDAKILSKNTTFGDEFTGARRQAPVDRWRDVGDPGSLAFIERELGTEMETVGYAT